MKNIVQNHTKELNLKDIGIYCITHKHCKNKIYIGSTKCKRGFLARWYAHLRLLKRKEHYSNHLQNLVNKYDLDGIEFKILERVIEKEDIYILEQKWLDIYNKDYILINYAPIVAACSLSINNEVRKKISKALKGKYIREFSSNAKSIVMYSSNGTYIKTFNCILDVCEEFGSQSSNFRLINKPLFHKGYLFSRKLLLEEEIDYFKKFNSCKKYWCRKPIYQYDLSGNFIKEWSSAEQIASYFKMSSGAINQAIKGKVKISKGFIWKYSNYQNPWDSNQIKI